MTGDDPVGCSEGPHVHNGRRETLPLLPGGRKREECFLGLEVRHKEGVSLLKL